MSGRKLGRSPVDPSTGVIPLNVELWNDMLALCEADRLFNVSGSTVKQRYMDAIKGMTIEEILHYPFCKTHPLFHKSTQERSRYLRHYQTGRKTKSNRTVRSDQIT